MGGSDHESLGVLSEWLGPSESVGADVSGLVVETVLWVEIEVGTFLVSRSVDSLETSGAVVQESLPSDETVQLVRGPSGEDWRLSSWVVWVGNISLNFGNLSESLGSGNSWATGLDSLELSEFEVSEWHVVGSGHGESSNGSESGSEFHLFFV